MTTVIDLLTAVAAFNELARAAALGANKLAADRDILEMRMRERRWRVKDINEVLGRIKVEYCIPVGEPASPDEPPLDIPATETAIVHGDPFEIPPHLRKAPPTREDTQS